MIDEHKTPALMSPNEFYEAYDRKFSHMQGRRDRMNISLVTSAKHAIENKLPVNTETVKKFDIHLPKEYTKNGELFVHSDMKAV